MPGFSAFFEYQFNPNQPNGGDGIAFLLQNSEYGTDALGKNGAGIGYGDSLAHGANGISESVAVELDNFLDSIMGDPDNMHISLHSVAHASNSAHENVSLALQEGIQGLQDNNTHWVRVEYNRANTTFLVYFDTLASPVINRTDFILEDYMILAPETGGPVDGRAFVGFTGSTGEEGALAADHFIKKFWFFEGNASLSADLSFAYGVSPSTTAGVQGTFAVQLVDANGFNVTRSRPDAQLTCALSGPNASATCQIACCDANFHFTGSFDVTTAGAYSMDIRLGSGVKNNEEMIA